MVLNAITTGHQLGEWVMDARRRTLELLADLSDEQLRGPRLPTVQPLLWELGHIAWFQEKWCLRAGGRLPSLRADADALYDSAAVPSETRWDLPLPDRRGTLGYLEDVCETVLQRLSRPELSPEDAYFAMLTVFHEDMHGEAFTYTRQTLSYPAAPAAAPDSAIEHKAAGPLEGDVYLPGGEFLLGAARAEPFVFDNEKWAHPVQVQPFAIARAPVTQQEFAAFVESGGYRAERFWSAAGWRWRCEAEALQPIYWRKQAGGRWLRRHFADWVPLEPHQPMIHVSWHEAEAYSRWAGRRLPTEAEWEAAALGERASSSSGKFSKRAFPWGETPTTSAHANLDAQAGSCLDVAALPAGDSAFGCRQMLGNVWEWTASDFGPFPGFVVDPYKEYSEPWFGTRKVLRGGCWATRARLMRPTYRNFFRPERRDIFAGFRTCAQGA